MQYTETQFQRFYKNYFGMLYKHNFMQLKFLKPKGMRMSVFMPFIEAVIEWSKNADVGCYFCLDGNILMYCKKSIDVDIPYPKFV
jgi:hypothetical protein